VPRNCAELHVGSKVITEEAFGVSDICVDVIFNNV
jgi:hypothetical protein